MEPIAIVGVGCRFPGAVGDLTSLWQLLDQGQQTWTEVPLSRFNGSTFQHLIRGTNASYSHSGGHFLKEDLSLFDASFFGISDTEAAAIDPQQRLLLEVAYEAIENAGIPSDALRGSNTGVYVAMFTHDYENMIYKDSITVPKYSMTGTGLAIAANRISYMFDLQGPSFTIDSGCSGSLVAIHQACQALQLGEIDMALVGGTNLILSPDTMMSLDLLHLLNSEGRCFPFDQRGSGYGRGEGVATIVLKTLSSAVQAGDNIHAVIKGSGVGQDGRTGGITDPSSAAQERLIRSVYRRAQLDPLETDYIEAHGTGTVKGDLAELQALSAVFCKDREKGTNLYVGSIKANIGHTEATSGIAGLIKAILTIQNGIIPGNPGLDKLKPQLESFTTEMIFPRESIIWPNNRPRRASINSFGYGGTNSHVIIEQWQEHTASEMPDLLSKNSNDELNGITGLTDHLQQMIVISAKSSNSLIACAENLKSWIVAQPGLDLRILAKTLNSHRSRLRYRCTLQASSREDLLNALQQTPKSVVRAARTQVLIFVFSGQGSQWFAMARELLSSSKFKNSIERSQSALEGVGATWDIRQELMKDEKDSLLMHSRYAQPIITAIQIGIFETLQSLGCQPDYVIGHSSGEIAAAYAAGALSQDTAIRIAFHRGSLAQLAAEAVSTAGAMVAVGLSAEDAEVYIDRIRMGTATLACDNSPNSTTVSGDISAIEELEADLNKFAIAARRLRTDTAYHSHHMNAVAEEYAMRIGHVDHGIPNNNVQFYSTVSTESKTSSFGAAYWKANLVSRVRFRETLENIYKNRRDASNGVLYGFVEIGPHSTLGMPIKQTFSHLGTKEFNFDYTSTLARHQDAHQTIMKCLATLVEWGVEINVDACNNLYRISTMDQILGNLPPYAWNHDVGHWAESRISRRHRMRNHPYHDLLGLRTPDDHDLEPVWRHLVSIDRIPWVNDHQVQGRIIFPGAGYLAMAIQAKTQVTRDRFPEAIIEDVILRDVVFSKLLEIPTGTRDVELRISFRAPFHTSKPNNEEIEEFRIHSITEDGSIVEHCSGRVQVSLMDPDNCSQKTSFQRQHPHYSALKTAQLLVRCDLSALYNDMEDMGHFWGPKFALITEIEMSQHVAVGTVQLPDVASYMPAGLHQAHVIHPTTLDAFIHSALLVYGRTCAKSMMFPVSIEYMRISGSMTAISGHEVRFETLLTSANDVSASFDLSVNMASGDEPCLEIQGGRLRGTGESAESKLARLENRDTYLCDFTEDIEMALSERQEHSDSTKAGDLEASQRRRLLDRAATFYIRKALKKCQESQMLDKHKEYVSWMVKEFEPGENDSLDSEWQTETEKITFERLGVEREAICRIGEALPRLLSGEEEPLALMLEGDLLERFYANDRSAIRCNEYLKHYIQQLCSQRANLRLLEIGAGTGGVTLPLLESLTGIGGIDLETYHFTDVSTGFFNAARNKLHRWRDIIEYQSLDISLDPTDQGFDANSYDVIIAYNALHVTHSIDTALVHARALLKPGGKLVLIEITQLPIYINAIFGLFPGWYLDHQDGRQDQPVISVNDWQHRLQSNGFQNASHVRNDFEGSGHVMSFIVANARSSSTPTTVTVDLLSSDATIYDLQSWSSNLVNSCMLRVKQLTGSADLLGPSNSISSDVVVICGDVEWRNDATEVIETLATSHKPCIVICSPKCESLMSSECRSRIWEADNIISVTVDESVTIRWNEVSTLLPRVIGRFLSSLQDGHSMDLRYYVKDRRALIPRFRNFERGLAMMSSDSAMRVALPSSINENPIPNGSSTSTRGSVSSVRIGDDGSAFPYEDVQVKSKSINPGRTFVLIGDHNGLGLDLCHYAISRGATNLILLTTSTPNSTYSEQFRPYFEAKGSKAFAFTWTLHGLQQCQAKLRTLPPISGIFIIDNFPVDSVGNLSCLRNEHADINQNDSRLVREIAEAPIGTVEMFQRIIDHLQLDYPLDFVLALRTSCLKSQPQIRTLESNALPRRRIDGVVVVVPVLKDITLAHQTSLTTEEIRHLGMYPLNKTQLHELLDEALSQLLIQSIWPTFVAGIKGPTLTSAFESNLTGHPFVSMLIPTLNDAGAESATSDQERTPQDISETDNWDDAEGIVLRDLRQLLSSLLAVEQDMIGTDVPIEDLGLDSLVMFHIRSWIFKVFRADLKTEEISDSPSVYALARTILSRSAHTTHLRERRELESNSASATNVLEASTEPDANSSLARQPLPELNATIESFLDSMQTQCTTEELAETRDRAMELLKTDGIGVRLQKRLFDRWNSPTVRNWLTPAYTENRFLRARSSLVPYQTFFGTHPDGRCPRTQSQQAAILTMAALRYKELQEAGNLPAQYLSGQLIDPACSRMLFHTSRIPGATQDELVTFPTNDMIVILHRNSIYKVAFRTSAGLIDVESMVAVFEAILHSSHEESSFAGTLTTTDRTEWARTRKLVVDTNSSNKQTIEAIESCAFVVCLDNATPETPEERFHQFFASAADNRWYDKSLQFVICTNGASASILEHSALDGVAIEPLHTMINEAINTDEATSSTTKSLADSVDWTLSNLSVSEGILQTINKSYQSFLEAGQKHTFAVLDESSLNDSLFSEHKWPRQSTIQLAIQLASRRLFGTSPWSLETVSLAHYDQGRVEVNPIIRPAMLKFIDAMTTTDSWSGPRMRGLAHDAVREHAKFLGRAGKGRAYGRHLLALEWACEPDEELPAFFRDSVYVRSKAAKVLTSTFAAGWKEGGFVYPVPGGILVYFETKSSGVSFTIFGNGLSAAEYRDHLAQTSGQIVDLLGVPA